MGLQDAAPDALFLGTVPWHSHALIYRLELYHAMAEVADRNMSQQLRSRALRAHCYVGPALPGPPLGAPLLLFPSLSSLPPPSTSLGPTTLLCWESGLY